MHFYKNRKIKLLIIQTYTFIVTKQLNKILTYVLFYIFTFGFYHQLNSSPKVTASFDQVVFIYVLHYFWLLLSSEKIWYYGDTY